MKKSFWILVIIIGGVLMIIGSAVGSAVFYQYLFTLADPYIGVEFKPLVSSLFTALEYIAFFGGYSILVAVFLILLKWYKVGRIIITIATSFGIMGLMLYAITYIVGVLGIPLDPPVQLILDNIVSLFTFNSGIAFAGTAVAVIGKFRLKRAVRAEKTDAKVEAISSSNNPGSKSCPNCGATLPLKANFCNKCGTNF